MFVSSYLKKRLTMRHLSLVFTYTSTVTEAVELKGEMKKTTLRMVIAF